MLKSVFYKKSGWLGLLFVLFVPMLLSAQRFPKREFRGVWIHTVNQDQYRRMTPAETKAYFDKLLDELQRNGINAVIFQVRPQADAFYNSKLEPWSRFLTGTQGQAPVPYWDPLAYLIEACHARNMELHAWLNPYRVCSTSQTLAADHIYFKHPEWFVEYGNQILFDPGLPQSRKFIREVVADIVTRYDVDAIHMDDYFYPYPSGAAAFPDDASFAAYGAKMGFGPGERADWRRQNVNILIRSLHETIRSLKPWVRFGISPFGIYRNRRSTPDGSGSDTKGLQNYDDLYADVLLWTREGWVDYLIPQLYWEIGHKAACFEKLIGWWNDRANGRHLYVGQSVDRTMDAHDIDPESTQLNRKMQLSRYWEAVSGNCFWPGYLIAENYGGVADALRSDWHRRPALIPAYDFIDDKAPSKVSGLKTVWRPDGLWLTWKRKKSGNEMRRQTYFAVYRFKAGEPQRMDDASHLIATTRETALRLPYGDGSREYVYVVTALNRVHNESAGKSRKVRL